MDPHRLNCPAAADTVDTEDWDNEDFVIPSLSVEESDQGDWEVSQASAPQPPPKQQPTKDTEKIYLGPHGAPPSRGKKQEESATAGQRDKNIKVKQADRKVSGTIRDNKGGFTRDSQRYNTNAGHHVK